MQIAVHGLQISGTGSQISDDAHMSILEIKIWLLDSGANACSNDF